MSVSAADINTLTTQAAAKYGVPLGLLQGLIKVEDPSLDPRAEGHNPDGSIDRGLVQINNQAHPEVSDAEAFDPSFAVPWAAQKLAALQATYGSWVGALEAYNSGSNNAWDVGYAQKVEAAGGYSTAETPPASTTAALAGAGGSGLAGLLSAGPAAGGSVGWLRWLLIGLAVVLGVVAIERVL